MSHRVSTTLPDDLWGRFDALREDRGHATEAETLRALVEAAVSARESEIVGRGQMALDPFAAPATGDTR